VTHQQSARNSVETCRDPALKKDFLPYSVLGQSSKLLMEPTPGFVATHTSAAGQRQEAVSAARRVTEVECSPVLRERPTEIEVVAVANLNVHSESMSRSER